MNEITEKKEQKQSKPKKEKKIILPKKEDLLEYYVVNGDKVYIKSKSQSGNMHQKFAFNASKKPELLAKLKKKGLVF